MKFRKIIVIILIILSIVNISTRVFAKYVFTYTQNAIELNIDRTPPKLNIEYSIKEPTAKGIEAKIIANEEIQKVNGWELQEDDKTLIKIYEENINETIIVKDLAGNESIANIIITNIDKNPPIAEIIEIKNTNTGFEKYANKTHEIILKVKISDTNKIINNLQDFKILVGDKENNCTKEINKIEEKENYIIYEVKLKNIDENGQLVIKILENSFEDIVGNKMSEKILNTEIEIDNISPIIEYNQKKLEDGKILAQIIGNEKIRQISGWELDETQKINSKKFISDIIYQKEVRDLAGNIANVEININDSEFLKLEYMGHISERGWIKTENNFVGTIQSGNKLKIEAIAFRTGKKVEKDFVQFSAYAYTHWGENSYAKDRITNMIYNHGWNPLSEYKTMANSEFANINNEKYIELSGAGINEMATTDLNGNNPIPFEASNRYEYGIAGLKLDLKSHEENSIIYQIYLNDIGWLETCKNGEQAMYAPNRPIEAMRIAVVPTSEMQEIIAQWNKNIV